MDGSKAMRVRTGESGQAVIEAALTLPLTIFLVLGTLQLFMVVQGRIMAQYAVQRAVRAGSINFGNCTSMMQAALGSVMPAVTRTDDAAHFVSALLLRADNHYHMPGHNAQIIELYREQPLYSAVPAPEDTNFDAPVAPGGRPATMEARMVFWLDLRIPFANAVMMRMWLAHFGLENYTHLNPLLATQNNAQWTNDGRLLAPTAETWPGGNLGDNMRTWADGGHYYFPIRVSAAMRMMTPAKKLYFNAPECNLHPPYSP